jgi:hypothetical protein
VFARQQAKAWNLNCVSASRKVMMRTVIVAWSLQKLKGDKNMFCLPQGQAIPVIGPDYSSRPRLRLGRRLGVPVAGLTSPG